MLSDRPYLRGDYQRERTSVLIWLISAILAGFVVQLLIGSPWLRGSEDSLRALTLSIPALRAGWVWTLFTYSFLHSPNFLIHVALNLFALYLLGRELLPMLGARRFLGLYAAATIFGGLAWTAVHWHFGGRQELMGATAAVDALAIVFACFFPNQELNFLLLFLFPVTLKPKHIAAVLVAFDLTALMIWEIPGAALPGHATIASSAHLGGMLTGFLYYHFVHDARWLQRGASAADLQLPRWINRARKASPPAAEVSNPTAAPEDIRAEVDRILDKINSQGFGALTPEEKRVLDEARDQLSRR
ncbi:MAG TPA: rhomboid family intramembrane serine protease [Opitutaceae bacterium]|nr:rhomboid family intramembrane serine protease [Opitutaceae bacterium]